MEDERHTEDVFEKNLQALLSRSYEPVAPRPGVKESLYRRVRGHYRRERKRERRSRGSWLVRYLPLALAAGLLAYVSLQPKAQTQVEEPVVARPFERLFRDDELLMLGRRVAEKRDFGRAINIFRKLSEAPDSFLRPEAQYRIAACYVELSKQVPSFGTDALREYQRCARLYPDSRFGALSRLEAASIYFSSGDYGRARRLCGEALVEGSDPQFQDALLCLSARCYLEQEAHAEALKQLERLTGEFPFSKHLALAEALSERARERVGKAAPPPKEEELLDLEERAAYIVDNYRGTPAEQAALRAYIRRYPASDQSAEATYLMARNALDRKEYQTALKLFFQIGDRWADSKIAPYAQLGLVSCYKSMGRVQRAYEEYKWLADRYPGNVLVSDALMRMGQHFYAKEQYDVALKCFSDLLYNHPDYELAENAFFKVAECHVRNESYVKSAACFQEFVRRYPESVLRAKALRLCGDAYLKANQREEALSVFRACIAQFPSSEEAEHARTQLALLTSGT